jgi:hypothetical protein
MDLTEGSKTSAKLNVTPGKYPKENIQVSEHGENLKSRTHIYVCVEFCVRTSCALSVHFSVNAIQGSAQHGSGFCEKSWNK